MRQNFRVVEGPILGWKQELRKNVIEERFTSRAQTAKSESPEESSSQQAQNVIPIEELETIAGASLHGVGP